MQTLSDHLLLFEDSCSVYVLRSGDEAVLIDFGTGAVLDALEMAGIRRVTDVLMTHHHRDQGQGLAQAVRAGSRIWVPHTEQDLFANVGAHWQARELFNSYNNRQDRLSLLEPVPVAGTLKDYGRYRFGDFTFSVVPTPGHTTGSISLVAEVDGARVAFTGDLIAAPGKLWSLAATQWSYNGAEGAAASVASLLDLKERRPDLLLPSHGEIMDEPAAAIDLLTGRLWQLLCERRQNPRLFSLRACPYQELTPHLLWNRTSMANGYVLLSESKKALFLDFGYDFMTGTAAGSDRASRRPWLYTLPALEQSFGVREIDVVVPTHYHDDHVAGCNLLRDVEGAEVWAAANFADILEHPSEFNLPCLWYDPIPVDRVLPLEEPVVWEEYRLTLYPQPGHTRYAVAIAFEVDGTRVLAVGDQYEGGLEAKWNYVYNNGFDLGDYRDSAELYRRLGPELILSGHCDPFRVEPGYFDRLDGLGEVLERLHGELLFGDATRPGAESAGLAIRPYQLCLEQGQTGALKVCMRNPFPHEATAVVHLAAPEGWQVDPEFVTLRLGGHAGGAAIFEVAPPAGATRRARLAADLRIDDIAFGQQAEALVNVQ